MTPQAFREPNRTNDPPCLSQYENDSLNHTNSFIFNSQGLVFHRDYPYLLPLKPLQTMQLKLSKLSFHMQITY